MQATFLTTYDFSTHGKENMKKRWSGTTPEQRKVATAKATYSKLGVNTERGREWLIKKFGEPRALQYIELWKS